MWTWNCRNGIDSDYDAGLEGTKYSRFITVMLGNVMNGLL